MAAPTFRSKTDYTGQATSPTITKPTGVVDNDVLLMIVISWVGNTTAVSTPSGWTPHFSKLNFPGGDANQVHVFWKRAASEPASWSLSRVANTYWHVCVLAYQGVITSGTPINVSGDDYTTANATSRTTPSVTTTVADCVVVPVLCNVNAGDPNFSASGTTERTDTYYGDIATNLWAGDFVQASAAATGTTTVSWTGTNGTYWQTLTIALQPAAAAAPTFVPQIIIS